MKCALYKEVLYLDKEIENIETLRDINNNKIKCTKSYYINNAEILLNYFIKNSYTQRYIIDLNQYFLNYFQQTLLRIFDELQLVSNLNNSCVHS